MAVILAVATVGFYFYHKKYRPKQKHLLPFQDTSIKLDIKDILSE